MTRLPPSQPLSYATRPSVDARTSRLAIASLAFAFLCSPCVTGVFSNWINRHLPRQFRQTGQYGNVHVLFTRGAMAFATALSVAAIARIALSRRTRTGMAIAVAALAVSLLWWVLLLALYLAFRGFNPD